MVSVRNVIASFVPSRWMRRQRLVWSFDVMFLYMTVTMTNVELPGNGGSCDNTTLPGGCGGGEREGRAAWNGTSFLINSGQHRID